MQAGNIRCDGIRRASVFNNIVRGGQALLARGLSGKNMFSMFAADLVTQHGAFDLRFYWHIDDQYAIGLTGQAVFDQQRYDPEEIRGGSSLHLAARFLLDWAAVIALVMCFIAFTLIKGSRFMSFNNMINILRAMSITTVFAIAATVTMAPDGFDMSACTLASCSAYVFVSMYLWYGLPLLACVLITIAVTLVMYQLTMFLILVCKIPDMLATCALQFVHQGLGQWYIGGGAVSTGMRTPAGAQPARIKLEPAFSAIGKEPWLIIIMLICVLIAHVFLEYTKHGRFIYAMGGNKQAAKLSGINVKAYRYLAGMITAVFVAIGGILVASRGSSAQVMCCDNYLMQSLAAVFVGRSVGGAERPNALGTLIGAMLVSTLENGLTICAVPFYVLPAVKGAVLALALVAAYATKKEQ